MINWQPLPPSAWTVDTSPLGVWMDTNTANKWRNAHSNKSNTLDYWLHIHHATNWLAAAGIPLINLSYMERSAPKWISSHNLDTAPRFGYFDYGIDNSHPGPISHRNFATQIYHRFFRSTPDQRL